MNKIIFATSNQHKMEEIRMIMADLNMEILSMKEAGIEADIEEDGISFEENAQIKAREVAHLYQKKYGASNGDLVMADDSGLEIDILNKEPGIYSARYMGEDTAYHIKNRNLLERLEGVSAEQRTARFVCAVAAYLMDGDVVVIRETIEGRIGYCEAGENGFGYDPIFIVPEYGCSSSELTPEQKNRISHRGKALQKMKVEIRRRLNS